MINVQLQVPPELHGQRADIILARLLPEYSRSQLSHWLKEGQITIDGQRLKPKEKLNQGTIINVELIDNPGESKTEDFLPENIPLTIAHEDDDLLILNKPAGMVVHPGAGNWQHTLVNALLFYHDDLHKLPRAGIIHRLDKDTTGLLLVAKSLQAYTALSRMMQDREIQRRYLTLVQGHVIAGGEVSTFFGRHPTNRLKMAVLSNGREAITQYSVLNQYQHFTLLEIQLLTGRTHQIRVHMAHIKHAVVGDPLYGTRARFPRAASPYLIQLFEQFKRQALHAHQLSFLHPFTKKELIVNAPLPDDFQQLLSSLAQHKEVER